MKTSHDGDASSNGRPGITALIEICHVVSHLLKGDTLQPEVLPLEPGEITVEVVGVGLDGPCGRAEFGRERIEPQLCKPSVGAYGNLRVGRMLAQHWLRTSCQKTNYANIFLSTGDFYSEVRIPLQTKGLHPEAE